jgi:hypothetical protein
MPRVARSLDKAVEYCATSEVPYAQAASSSLCFSMPPNPPPMSPAPPVMSPPPPPPPKVCSIAAPYALPTRKCANGEPWHPSVA